MAGVYAELGGFVLAHRECAGPRRADASLAAPSGNRLLVRCGYALGDAPEDADEDLLRSVLLAFEN